MKMRARRCKAHLRGKKKSVNTGCSNSGRTLYSGNELVVLMGMSDFGRPRLFMIGRPESEQEFGDEGLALLEIRSDGIYVKSMADDNKHRSVEISFIAGDTQGRRKSGLPLLPFPFTVDELRRVDGGAIGIIERISCGYQTRSVLEEIKRSSEDAFNLACALLGAEGAEQQEDLMRSHDNLAPIIFD